MYKSKTLSNIVTSLIVIISFVITINLFLIQNSLPSGYRFLYLLPLSYGLLYVVFLHRVTVKYGFSLFLAVYIVVSFVRYVILSYLVVNSGWYYGRSNFSPIDTKFRKAIYLMVYELFAYNLAIFIFHKILFKDSVSNTKINSTLEDIKFNKNNFVYISFVLFTLLLVALKPSSLQFFSFISINSNYTTVEESDALVSIIIIFINVSRYIVYFMLVKFFMERFYIKHPIFAFTSVVIITLINAMILFGTNRSDFIFGFIINLLILVYLFRRYGVALGAFLITLVPVVVGNMTKYRETTTITNGSNKLIDITDNLQVYLAGVYNVAISLDMSFIQRSPAMLLVDVFRSAIGPNVILKQFNFISSSKLFNVRLFSSDHVSQIVPMIGQSNLYLGFIFSPLLGIAFIFIALYLLKQIIKVKRFELIYILSLSSGRMGFVMAQNGNILINDLTFFLPLFLLVYYLNNKVVLTNEK